MDLNIFFSSLAQGVGGLVGIFAAFIITKIVNNQTEFERKKSKLKEEINDSKLLQDRCGVLYFDWYCKQRMRFGLRAIDSELDREEARAPEEYYEEFNFPIYKPRNDVLAAIRETIANHRPRNQNSFFVPPVVDERDLIREVNNEGEKIENALIDVKNQIRIAKGLRTEVESNPESSSAVTHSIIAALVLFFFGFIYPLSFLPLQNGQEITLTFGAFFSILCSLRGLLLLIPSVIFTITMLYFGKINGELKYPSDQLEELATSTSLSYYSPYFDIRLGNERAALERVEVASQEIEPEQI